MKEFFKAIFWPMTIAIGITAILVVLSSGLIDQAFNPKYENLPPGFRLMCDGEGNYRSSFSDVHVIIDPYRHQLLKNTKRAAIKRAWGQYEYQQLPPPKADTTVWHPCE